MELNFPKIEKEILEFWKENRIFEKSIRQRARARDFVFYEGPPTANGKPGIHHVLSRVFKDIICRYKTMQGFRVQRKAGWDTHGLPVELEIEKKLGLKNKKDIEKYGIAEFNKKCKESVWQYKDEWEKLTERIGYWLDMEHPYITYENNYIETLWWIIKQIYQKELLYKDYKVLPYCPRCGTSLSSHEVALGYKKIKEPAIYIKLKITSQNSKLLVWTTTPWTLPGNVAVAINPDFIYAKVKVGEEYLILAKERMKAVGIEGEITEKFKGKDLLGLEYEPPYRTEAGSPYARVIAGEFVSLEEGTGIVHIAPAFGEDDMRVGKENNLPVILNVDEEGKFKKEVKSWAGLWVKDADPLIIEDLKNRNLLFKEELYEHDYPFCWRCGSPLLYYAKESWFIKMQEVKQKLIENNEKINWVPAHLKEGRFGEWLKELKDWAFSRERYWGTPLPIWQCQKCGSREAIGSMEDLSSRKTSNNHYYIFRHGHSERQIKNVASCWPEEIPLHLTPQGKKEVENSAIKIKNKKIDLIFFSDLLRTKQTAEIISRVTGAKTIADERLREVNVGIFNGKDPKLFWDYFANKENPLSLKSPEGESLVDLGRRMYDFLKDIDGKYQNKNILMVSHELPLSLLEGLLNGWPLEKTLKWRKEQKKKVIQTGQWREIKFRSLPFSENLELDFHRPYIDEVKFRCQKCGGVMQRVAEVIDCWFDSGSMPFASQVAGFPADYISEAIDQTRGWFYTLLAIATLMGRSAPYKNVISLGHVLDEKGEKMSKSKGNVVDPWYIIEKYGADASRWYFYTVNQPGEPKLFSEKDVDQALKKFILTFWNSFQFFQTYIVQNLRPQKSCYSKNILDKWIISRLNGLIRETTEKLDKYDVVGAARSIENFVINDLSLWYIRRSRKRFEEAQNTLAFVLLTLSELTAPFIPFLSEEIYKGTKNYKIKTKNSVHLTDWPKADKKLINKKLEEKMRKVRKIVASALAERAKAGIKVRQPLQKLQVADGKLQINEELLNLIRDEINVKEITFGKNIKLDTKITLELEEEGIIREVIRQIQEMRKKAGLKPADKISIQYFGSPALSKILEKNKKTILTETKAKDFRLAGKPLGQEILINQEKLCLFLTKINK